MSFRLTWLNRNTFWGQLSIGAKRNLILSFIAVFFVYGGYRFIISGNASDIQKTHHNKALKHILTGKTYVPKPAALFKKEKINEINIDKTSSKLSKLETLINKNSNESSDKLLSMNNRISSVFNELKKMILNKTDDVSTSTPEKSMERSGKRGMSKTEETPVKIYTYFDADEKTINKQDQAAFRKTVQTVLPAGTLITGVLLTGMDAPTVSVAKAQWIPVLVRIKTSAILPNYHRMNLKECFLLGTGFGDLSSERAKIRATYLSCIRYDGEVLKTKVNGIAIGEDAKAGLRGKVVTRNGALIARAALAGFFGGVGKSLQPNQIPQINIGASQSSSQYSSTGLQDILKVGALGGTSSSLERITKFYMDMAEQIFPVIEISAGRKITFLVNDQGTINGKNKKDHKK